MVDADSQISLASCFLDYTSSVTIQIARIAQPSRQSANMNKKICQAWPNHVVCNQWWKRNCARKCLNEAEKIVESLNGLVEVTIHMWETITVILIITILIAINIVNTMRPIILHNITSKPQSFDNCVCSSQQNWQRLSSQLAEPNLQCTSTIALVIAFPGVLTINISRPSVILLRCPKNKSQLIIVGNRGQVS